MNSGGPSDERQRHLRWKEMQWERHRRITRKEQLREEVREIFREIVEVSRHRVMPPRGKGG